MIDRINLQKLEILNGDRPRAKNQAAVRWQDVGALNSLEPKSKAAAGAEVTVEEYDALVQDIATIMKALSSLKPR